MIYFQPLICIVSTIPLRSVDVQNGDLIRLDQEVIRVISVDRTLDNFNITVERAVQGTQAVAHSSGTEIFAGDRVTLAEFFLQTQSNPQIGEFGIWALANSTFMTTLTAMLVALPLGLGVAIYLSEYASVRARSVLKPILEVTGGRVEAVERVRTKKKAHNRLVEIILERTQGKGKIHLATLHANALEDSQALLADVEKHIDSVESIGASSSTIVMT